jgi:hypothetical protein
VKVVVAARDVPVARVWEIFSQARYLGCGGHFSGGEGDFEGIVADDVGVVLNLSGAAEGVGDGGDAAEDVTGEGGGVSEFVGLGNEIAVEIVGELDEGAVGVGDTGDLSAF